MKRAKQTNDMIAFVNEYLKVNHIKDENDDVFWIMCRALISAGVYKGFNYYTKDGRLSGGENTDYLQIY